MKEGMRSMRSEWVAHKKFLHNAEHSFDDEEEGGESLMIGCCISKCSKRLPQ